MDPIRINATSPPSHKDSDPPERDKCTNAGSGAAARAPGVASATDGVAVVFREVVRGVGPGVGCEVFAGLAKVAVDRLAGIGGVVTGKSANASE
jgi:hypothetical protein